MQNPTSHPQRTSFQDAFYRGSGSVLIREGLNSYGGKFLGSSSEFMQSNIGSYFSDPQYYFQINLQYVRNKLKIILFPFLHRGQWTRISEPSSGGISYKPPIFDVNAPDLYIPLMSLGTYLLLAGFTMGLRGIFSPDALALQLSKSLVAWLLHILLLKVFLYYVGSRETVLLDIVSYAGYVFMGASIVVGGGMFLSRQSYYLVLLCAGMSGGMFLVNTVKRIVQGGRNSGRGRINYLLLSLVAVQLVLLFWLGNLEK